MYLTIFCVSQTKLLGTKSFLENAYEDLNSESWLKQGVVIIKLPLSKKSLH